MLVDLVDHMARSLGVEASAVLGSGEVDPWAREALGRAEGLLDRVRLLREGEHETQYEQRCRADIDELYGDYSTVLLRLQNLLDRGGVHKPPVRLQMVRVHLSRRSRSWDALPETEIQRVVDLLGQNLEENPSDAQSLRLWVQAVRRLPTAYPVDRILERVSHWRNSTDELEALYYMYVFYAVKAIEEGTPLALQRAQNLLLECRTRAGARRNRTRSFEWWGREPGAKRLVHQSRLGEWDDSLDFWAATELLGRLDGTVATVGAPQRGTIRLDCGLSAFFVPRKADLHRDRDENVRVSFLLGFSYDGPRAWEVRLTSHASA